jgi:hypothetical protein
VAADAGALARRDRLALGAAEAVAALTRGSIAAARAAAAADQPSAAAAAAAGPLKTLYIQAILGDFERNLTLALQRMCVPAERMAELLGGADFSGAAADLVFSQPGMHDRAPWVKAAAEEELGEVAMSEGRIVEASMEPRRMAASWDLERVRAMISRGCEAMNSSVATLPAFFVRYSGPPGCWLRKSLKSYAFGPTTMAARPRAARARTSAIDIGAGVGEAIRKG